MNPRRVAQAAQVASIAKAIKASNGPFPLCGAGPFIKTASLTLRDANGEPLGTVVYSCSAGTATLAAGKTFSVFVAGNAVEDVAKAERVPAGVLFGVDALTVTRPQQPAKTVKVTGAAIAGILAAIDLNAIDAKASESKCLPLYVVKFLHTSKEVAALTFECANSAPLPRSLDGAFSTPASGDARSYLGAGSLKPAAIDDRLHLGSLNFRRTNARYFTALHGTVMISRVAKNLLAGARCSRMCPSS